ncbi:hypothetical protein Pfo_004207 [Paulownia fortunei]|nr:hypothetical protein Pfo_004207 [Paulownia fortunei]
MQAKDEAILIKGKRSKRPRPASPLALTMATSSSTTAEFSGGGSSGGGVISDISGSFDRATVNLSPSNSGELTQGRDEVEEDMAHCLILLAKGQNQKPSRAVAAAANKGAAAAVDVYQCKTCNKSFPSFQALGGHRASHKKPIKPVALEEKKPLRDLQENSPSNHDDSTILSLRIPSRILGSPQNKTRVHECSICGAEFASGQALGGHMRRHRPIPTVAASSHGESQEAKRLRNLLSLDLNLPAPEDHDHRDSKFPFAPQEQVIVFSSSPLVDCHY